MEENYSALQSLAGDTSEITDTLKVLLFFVVYFVTYFIISKATSKKD